MTDRAGAERLDGEDPLSEFRSKFLLPTDGPIYLNGNSLGALSETASAAIAEAVAEWGSRLVRGWAQWIDLPTQVGDRIGEVIGCASGEVMACDSTTVNLYKMAAAALEARPMRGVIVADANDFPTDRYVLAGLAETRNLELRMIRSDPVEGIAPGDLDQAVDEQTALVCLSHVNYRSGARLDLPAVTELAHDRGALVLWDLCHSAGAVPVQLGAAEVDLAVGCTYKYLNAGPGAPAYLFARADLQKQLRQPVWGWFGQEDQFAMGPRYRPDAGIRRFATGTPAIIGLLAVAAGLDTIAEAGIERLWAKSQTLCALLVDLIGERLTKLGVRLASPADPARRGAHVSIAHPNARRLCDDLAARNLVIGDFREPDSLRLCPAPLYTRFVDVFDAVDRIAESLSR